MSTRNVPASVISISARGLRPRVLFLTWCDLFSIFVDQQRTLVKHGATKMTFTNLPSGDDTTLESRSFVLRWTESVKK